MEIDHQKVPPENMSRQRLRTRTQRRLLSGINSVAAIFLVLVLVLMVNYISLRNYSRIDVSKEQYFQLSDKTKSLLSSLEERVRVIVFIQPGHEIYHHVYNDVLQLLSEYEYASGNRIHIERIDPDRNLARSEEIVKRYQLDAPNVVIFEYEDRKKVVSADELMEIDYTPMMRGQLPEKVAFRGEQIFSSAILSITKTARPRVYFLQGFGERDFEDRDEYVGLSSIAREIRRDDIELLPFSFHRQGALPQDADAIIIAGPTRTYSDGAMERITAYAKRSGSLVLLLNSETDAGFGSLLRELGIQSVDNLVIDPTRSLSGFDLLISDYADHPITRRMADITSIFYWPRALPLLDGENGGRHAADKPRATGIAFSSDNAWAELDHQQRPYRYDAERDIKGPIPVAVAVERGPIDSVDMDIQPLRAVIFGDVDFISNSGLSGGNSDLFMNALNWVMERDELIAISPKPVNEVKLLITARQLGIIFWLVVVATPGLVAFTGLVAWISRRK